MTLSGTDRALTDLIRAACLHNGSNLAEPTGLAAANWSALVARAQMHGLAPLLYTSVKICGLQDTLPVEAFGQLRIAYIRADIAIGGVYQELDRLLDSFTRAQLPVILLKGCALGSMLYANVNLRPLGDIDILVPQSAIERVGALLVERGYERLLDLQGGFRERFGSEQCYFRRGKHPAMVDVHWHLFNVPEYRTRIPVEWFWQRTMEIRLNGRNARVLAPEAQLLHLAPHFMFHHQGQGMRWSYDIALLLTRYRAEIRWDEVVNAARVFGLSEALRATLAHVADVWGVAVPADCLRDLRPGIGARVKLAMETAPQRDAQVIWGGANVAGARDKLAFLLQIFFPSPQYMQTRYRIKHLRLLPLYYLYRLVRGADKFVISAFSMLANIVRVLSHARNLPEIR